MHGSLKYLFHPYSIYFLLLFQPCGAIWEFQILTQNFLVV